MAEIAKLKITDLVVGDEFSFEELITEKMIDSFAGVSGDYSSIHMDSDFARERGFERRVAHGVLLASLFSQLVGMHCPGENALLQSVNLKFSKPIHAGDRVRMKVVVDQISHAARSMILRASAEEILSGQAVATGKIQVGFTEPVKNRE